MFALDTNLLMYPGPRRLLSGIALDTDQSVGVLPVVQQEMVDNRKIAIAETRRWKNKIRRASVTSIIDEDLVIEMIQPVVKDWFQNVFLQARPYIPLLIDDRDSHQVDRVAFSIPRSAFHGLRTEADRRMIGEAVYLNVPLFGSHDTTSITHKEINDWAHTKGYNAPLIRSPSELIFDLCENDIHTAYQWVMAFNSNRDDLTHVDNKIAFLNTLNAVGRSGFDEEHMGLNTLISKLKARLDIDETFQDTFEQAIQKHIKIRRQVMEIEHALVQCVNKQILPYEQSLTHDLQQTNTASGRS